ATILLQAVATMLLVILVCHQWVISTLPYYWLPGLTVACLPFLVGLAEAALAWSIGPDTTRWFARLALTCLIGLAASRYVRWRATSERRNAPVWTVRRHAGSYYGWTAGIVGLASCLWWLARAGHVSPTRAVWPAFVLATQVGFVAISQLQVRIALHRALV